MPRRIAVSTLNASTYDILNTIRANASAEYRDRIPTVTTEVDIPKVGEYFQGYPSLANEFIESLVNRIAFVAIRSANFNNLYRDLKKGMLGFGETVEDVFVSMTKARIYSPDKASAEEFKRNPPKVDVAFHSVNWKVRYPITIQQEELHMAFTSMNGVQDMITKIINAVYTAAEYDEFLLFKYLIIKAVSHGKMKPIPVDTSDIKNAAIAFRGTSNMLEFVKSEYNEAHVATSTPKADQHIFMDARFNADYDVNVLASAFNMDKADFEGRLRLIDDFTTFDNERFAEITAESDCIESVTSAELALMANVKAVLLDKEWFQIYDKLSQMESVRVTSGLYWNYNYHNWKVVSTSPFSNAVVFVDNSADTDITDNITVEVTDKSISEEATVLTLVPQSDDATLERRNVRFVQTAGCIDEMIAVHPYGAIIYPANADAVKLQFYIDDVLFESASTVGTTVDVGDTLTFTRKDYVDDTLSALSITGVTLTPTFAKGTLTYTGATSTASGTLTATASSSSATKKVQFNGTDVTGTSLSFSAGAGNVLTIDMGGMSEGKPTTKQYKVTITKS